MRNQTAKSASSAPLGALILLLASTGCGKKPTIPPAAAPKPSTVYTQIDPATSGTIAGTIHFAGKAPAPIEIDMAEDPKCGLAGNMPNDTQQYIVHHGGLANVFVYIKAGLGSKNGLGDRIYKPSSTPVVLDQRGCRFVPHVIGVMVGQPVEFRNSDPTVHNVHIVPPGDQDASGVDISQPPMRGTQQHVFHTAGLMVPVRCNNHPWMEAFLNIAKNPFFAVSDGNGRFTIQGLPPGTYTLVAVHEKLGTQTQSITIQSHKTTNANFTFQKR